MKKIMFILLLVVMSSCDPLPTGLNIYNYSNEVIYVYHKYGNVDSLPLKPKLSLFYNDYSTMIDHCGNKIFFPVSKREYRIDPYAEGEILLSASPEPKFQKGETEITMFFIAEKTMRKYRWKEIYEGQLYESRVVLTEDEAKDKCWRYIYIPLDRLVKNVNN